MTRRLRAVAVGLLAAGAALVFAAPALADRPLGLPVGQPILFSLQSEAGSFERAPGRGRFTLTLTGVVPRGVWFTDRPARDSGSLRAGAFFGAWRALGFHRDPPNAVLAVPAGRGRARAVAVELGAPRWNARTETVRFRARVLRRAVGGLSHLDDDLRGGVPARFSGASLFVDDVIPGSSSGACSYMAQLDMFPAGGVPLPQAYLPATGLLLPIMQHTALYALIGRTFGGDGRVTFMLPRPPPLEGMRYGICERGLFPPRADPDVGGAECTTGSLSLQAQTYRASGWLPADGRILRIADFPGLFDELGTAFGGDGTTTFGLPSVADVDEARWYVCVGGELFRPGEPTWDACILSQLTLFGTRGLPSNYTPADGRMLQIGRDRAALFTLFGTAFGGDGQSTFALPRFAGPVPGTTWAVCSEGIWPS